MAETIQTPLTKLLGIKYPVLLAGMNGEAPSPTPNTAHTHTTARLSHTLCFRLMRAIGISWLLAWLRTPRDRRNPLSSNAHRSPPPRHAVVAGPELAAAVSNCGGLGSIGGVG
jgi:hypothetical protein